VRAISYRGELVAIATRARVYLAPQVSALAQGTPKQRFVAAMCLYSRDVDESEVPGPYTDEGAELYARCFLIPDESFEGHAAEQDDHIARRFGVPIEQVPAKRRDVGTYEEPVRPGAPGWPQVGGAKNRAAGPIRTGKPGKGG
jgi:hypothetical protein